MLRLLESDIYTLFVGLTLDVLVGGLSGEISDDVTESLSGCAPAFVV
jgi:hypothetical protein